MNEKFSDYFGVPPVSIQPHMVLDVNHNEQEFRIIHSSVLTMNDQWFRNYTKTVHSIIESKYPDYKLLLHALDADAFRQLDLSAQNAEISESSKIQKDILGLIGFCVSHNGSDIHIDTHMSEAVIRVRVNGELFVAKRIPKDHSSIYISVIYNTMCDVAESMYTSTEFQDAVFARRALPRELSGVRVTCGPSMNGPFMVLRLLYNENINLNSSENVYQQLGYTQSQADNLELLASQPSGIIFVAGPTGSGKSTTLKYVIKNIASDPSLNFISVEDPPEYNIPGVRQIPVAVKSDDMDRDSAFSKTIRSSLRSDPDRIMIGEIRDTAAAVMAITYAQTGHQVWTTVHANGTFAILSRMLAILVGTRYSERQAISVLSDATIVNGLIFQRLVPILCPHCRIPLAQGLEKGLIKPLHYKSLRKAFREQCLVSHEYGINEDASEKLLTETLNEKVFVTNRHAKDCSCNRGISSRTTVSELVYTTSDILADVFERSPQFARRRWNSFHKDETLQANARRLIIEGRLDPGSAINAVGLLEADIMERDDGMVDNFSSDN